MTVRTLSVTRAKKGDSLYLGYSGDKERVIFYTSGVPRTKKG